MTSAPKDQQLLPAYLIVGEDALKRETAMKRLRARLSSLGDLSFNSDVFKGDSASGSDIVSACNTLPFASPVRLVEVRGAESLAKADAEAIVTYLAAPSDTTVLALTCEKLAKNTRLYKAVAKLGKSAVIDCAPPARRELPKLVRSMAQSHGITLTAGAVDRLIDLVGEDTVRLDGELKKLALSHRGGGSVNEHEVASTVGRTAEAKPWEFVDAFSARNVHGCIDSLQRMPSASPYALLPMCIRRLRELICARSLMARGSVGGLSSELHIPDWQAKKRVSWARGFSDEELRRAIVSGRDAERAMKSGSDPEGVLVEWVVSVASRPRDEYGAY